MHLSPIALFTYTRLDHTQRTIEALLLNPEAVESDLIIFSDAAASHQQQDDVASVREYLSTVTGFRSINIVCRERNYGLANSIIDGVSDVLRIHESLIVLEDDMVTSPFFLAYMNEALQKYAKDERVISIHAYTYPVNKKLPEAFFLLGADCWGWGTWRRGWQLFNPDGQSLADELSRRNLIKLFNYNNSCAFYEMLKDQIAGANNSWAIRWYASAFLANKLTLYPGRSLVHNIGNDSSGTHCVTSSAYDAVLSTKKISFSQLEVKVSVEGFEAFESFFRQTFSLNERLRRFWARIKNTLK